MIYMRKNLTKSGMKEFIKPYLLRNHKITHANQFWCTEITYLPMRKGFLYMTVIIDIYSRKIVGWCISKTISAQWCRNVLEDAIARHDKPEIVNSVKVASIPVLCGRNILNNKASVYRCMARAEHWIMFGSSGSVSP
jgi:transposase InsO family protein